MTRKHMILTGTGVVLLMLVTAGASAYITQNSIEPKEEKVAAVSQNQKITWNEQRQQPQAQAQPAKPACNDSNIVGTALGAVGGGLVGSQIGSGKGQDLATIGGAVAGGFAGHEYIPTHNTLCPK